jgi:integrase/recombinase XerD
MEGFRLWLQTQGHNRETVRHYVSYATHYVSWLRDHEADYLQATRYEVAAYLGERSKHLRPGSLDNVHGALRSFYDYLEDEEIFKSQNPARRVPRPRSVPRRATEAFTQLELQRLHAACRDFRERAILMLLLGTALRRSEMIQVTRESINWETGMFTVLGKGAKYRRIKLSPSVIEALRPALAFEDKLWPWTGATLWHMIQRLGKRAGLEGRVHPHRFRATSATEHLDAGATVEQVQTLLGHASVGMTLRYAQSGRERRALEGLSGIDLPSRLLGPPEAAG